MMWRQDGTVPYDKYSAIKTIASVEKTAVQNILWRVYHHVSCSQPVGYRTLRPECRVTDSRPDTPTRITIPCGSHVL